MSETYCGKTCDCCAEKQQLKCPGCRMGPGRAFQGDCTISKCCVSRKLSSCTACTTASTCYNLRSSASAASVRLQRQKDETARQKRMYERSVMMGKSLLILFWLVIVSTVVGLFLNENAVEQNPALALPYTITRLGYSVAYALVLCKMNDVSECYEYAGISGFVAAALTLVASLLGASGWAVFLSLVTAIPSFICEYQEYMGHAEATEEMDPDMAKKWRTLWYWNLGCLCATIGGTLLTLIGLLIAALIVAVAAIGVLVVSIIKIIFLYRTAKAFREYSEENAVFI